MIVFSDSQTNTDLFLGSRGNENTLTSVLALTTLFRSRNEYRILVILEEGKTVEFAWIRDL